MKDLDLTGIDALLVILREKGVNKFVGYGVEIHLNKPYEMPAYTRDGEDSGRGVADISDYGTIRDPLLWGGTKPEGFR